MRNCHYFNEVCLEPFQFQSGSSSSYELMYIGYARTTEQHQLLTGSKFITQIVDMNMSARTFIGLTLCTDFHSWIFASDKSSGVNSLSFEKNFRKKLDV